MHSIYGNFIALHRVTLYVLYSTLLTLGKPEQERPALCEEPAGPVLGMTKLGLTGPAGKLRVLSGLSKAEHAGCRQGARQEARQGKAGQDRARQEGS